MNEQTSTNTPQPQRSIQAFTAEEFIASAKAVHGDTYDYSSTNYFNSKTPVTIICKIHGTFNQLPTNHTRGVGCPKCGRITQGINKSKSTQDFINKATKIHDGYYSYESSEYIGALSPITITCPVHGEFTQLASNHLRGRGCKECGNRKTADKLTRSFEDFMTRVTEVHGSKYQYTPDSYTFSTDKMTITCPKHGEFTQRGSDHLRGQGCPTCGRESQANNRRWPIERFINKALVVHGSKYSYEDVEYTTYQKPVTITCSTHGKFSQTPDAHLHGAGCPKCASEQSAVDRMKTTEQFIQEATDIHKGKYSYENVNYEGARKYVTITCPSHGDFQQTPGNHLKGVGCPNCATTISRPHQLIIDVLTSENIPHQVNNRTILEGKELDIFLPDYNLAIEINGLYWHSSKFNTERNYHQQKTDACREKGIQLLSFWDSEVLENLGLVVSMIMSKINKSTTRVYARSCRIKEVTAKSFSIFCLINHIQGATAATKRIGLWNGDNLVAVMGFMERTNREPELVRYAVKRGHSVPGGFSRLLTHAERNYGYSTVVSFSDDAYSNGAVYEHNGFTLDKVNPPRLYYTEGIEVRNRRQFQRKLMLQRHPELDPTLSERDMAEALGFYQLYGHSTRRWIRRT